MALIDDADVRTQKVCVDPWLIDVSGRCPVCQRPVQLEDVEPKKSKRRRR